MGGVFPSVSLERSRPTGQRTKMATRFFKKMCQYNWGANVSLCEELRLACQEMEKDISKRKGEDQELSRFNRIKQDLSET